jgi:putative ABC transport system substrate-binding protein
MRRRDFVTGIAGSRRPVALLMSSGGSITALTAKAATTTIPIVFTMGADPVALHLVESLNRPGGNVTGVSFLATQLDPKLLELLAEVTPKAADLGVIINPNNPNSDGKLKDVQAAAGAVGRRLIVASAGTEHDLEPAFRTLSEQHAARRLQYWRCAKAFRRSIGVVSMPKPAD